MHLNTHNALTRSNTHYRLEKESRVVLGGGIIIDGIEFPALQRAQIVFSREGLLTARVYTMALLGSVGHIILVCL